MPYAGAPIGLSSYRNGPLQWCSTYIIYSFLISSQDVSLPPSHSNSGPLVATLIASDDKYAHADCGINTVLILRVICIRRFSSSVTSRSSYDDHDRKAKRTPTCASILRLCGVQTLAINFWGPGTEFPFVPLV